MIHKVIFNRASQGCWSRKCKDTIGAGTNKSFSFSVDESLWCPVQSHPILCCPVFVPLPPVLKQRRHSELKRPGVAVCAFSVSLCTVAGQRQYWGGRHGAGSTGYSYRLASVCAKSSLRTHNRRCVQFLPTPSFVLSDSFSISHSLYLLSSFFCLEQVGLHWSRHLEYRWEALIPEGLRTDLCIWDHSLNCHNTKKRGGGGMNFKETELCFKLSHIQQKLAEYTEYLV